MKTNFRTKLRIAAAALAVAAVPLIQAAPLQAQTRVTENPADLQRAVAALRSISTMQADFLQTDRNGQRVTGVMTLKRPGKIRFQYQRGVPMLIVADGNALTLVDYEVRQVQRWPIKNSPLGALLDPNRDVGKFGTLQPTIDPNVISIMVRDRSHPEYGVINLIFVRNASAPGGLELASWVALDSQGKRTMVRLSNQRYGIAVPDSMFRYTDPRPAGRR